MLYVIIHLQIITFFHSINALFYHIHSISFINSFKFALGQQTTLKNGDMSTAQPASQPTSYYFVTISLLYRYYIVTIYYNTLTIRHSNCKQDSNEKYFIIKTSQLITTVCMQHYVTCLTKALVITNAFKIAPKMTVHCCFCNYIYR